MAGIFDYIGIGGKKDGERGGFSQAQEKIFSKAKLLGCPLKT